MVKKVANTNQTMIHLCLHVINKTSPHVEFIWSQVSQETVCMYLKTALCYFQQVNVVIVLIVFL